jgi:hypothetical protein
MCAPMTWLSNLSGMPLVRGNRDERKTWSTLDLISVENAGSSKQGNTCMMTEVWYYSTHGCNGLCRLRERYRQRDKRRQLL